MNAKVAFEEKISSDLLNVRDYEMQINIKFLSQVE